MNRLHILAVIVIFICGCSTISKQKHISAWCPVLTKPVKSESQKEELCRLTGIEQKPETVWIVKRDINGDLREDTIITMSFGKAAGPRAYLNTRKTFVILGNRPKYATFNSTKAHIWFSLRTYYCLSRVKYPDEEVVTQFSLDKNMNQWLLHIHETQYTNKAGDSSSRGMYVDAERSSTIPLKKLDSWRRIDQITTGNN